MDKQDWSNEFSSFVNSALGKELLRALREDVHDNIIRDAEKSESQEKAFGLLKEASGVIKSIEHIMFLSAAMSKDEG